MDQKVEQEGDKRQEIAEKARTFGHICSQCAWRKKRTVFLDVKLSCPCCGRQYDIVNGSLCDIENELRIVNATRSN